MWVDSSKFCLQCILFEWDHMLSLKISSWKSHFKWVGKCEPHFERSPKAQLERFIYTPRCFPEGYIEKSRSGDVIALSEWCLYVGVHISVHIDICMYIQSWSWRFQKVSNNYQINCLQWWNDGRRSLVCHFGHSWRWGFAVFLVRVAAGHISHFASYRQTTG